MRRLTLLLSFVVVVAVALGVSGAASPSGPAKARWVIRDLGLGGATGLNERGVIVGSSPIKTPLEHGSMGHAVLWSHSKLRYLRTLRGSVAYTATSGTINERDQIIGANTIDDSPSRTQAFLWEAGRVILLPGDSSAIAYAVNDRGQVVGWTGTTVFFHGHASLWKDGKLIDLGALPRLPNSRAVAINDRGQIVGSSQDNRRETGDPAGRERACLWQNGKLIALESLPGRPNSWAVAINNYGQVVGVSNAAGTDISQQPDHAFLWQNGRTRDLGTLGGKEATATAINERGQVIGGSVLANGNWHAFLWQNGQMTDLGTLPGDRASTAVALNERGQVIGTSYARPSYYGPHPFVWQNGAMTALPTLGGAESAATALNNHNQIVGWSTTKNGQRHAVLWTLKTGG